MIILLLNLVLWPLAILALIPLLLHLFARKKPPAYRFSSVEFIQKIIRQTNRVKKPQDLFLLIIRTLIFSLLIFLFLQPLFFFKRRLSNPFESKNVVFVVDATASMGYTEGAQTRFSAACAEASEILSGLTSKDKANIIWLRAKPTAVFPSLGVNFSHLQSELKRAGVTTEAGDTQGALRLADEMLKGAEGRKEIHVFSDFQQSGWEKTQINPGTGVDMVMVAVGKEKGANGAVTDIYFDPACPLPGEDVSICCDVINYSDRPQRRTVFLVVQESRQSQDVMVPAWNKATVLFRYKFQGTGTFPVRVSLNDDSFSGDDSRWALVEVSDSLHIALVGGDRDLLRVWKKVFDSVGWAKVDMPVKIDPAGLARQDAVMLAGDDGKSLEAVLPLLIAGRCVVWAPSMEGATFRTSLTNSAAVEFKFEKTSELHKLRIIAEKDGLFSIFSDGAYGDPSRGLFSGRHKPNPDSLAGAELLMAYDDGVPALVRWNLGGKLFLWNIPLGQDTSDYARQPEFVTLLSEMILTSRSHPRDLAVEFLPGDRPYWKMDNETPSVDVKLVGADGKDVLIEEKRSSSFKSLLAPPASEPGLLTWEMTGRKLGYSIINFPPAESDLRTMSKNELEKKGTVSVETGASVRLLREGVKLWPILLVSIILLALLEGLVLLWAEKT